MDHKNPNSIPAMDLPSPIGESKLSAPEAVGLVSAAEAAAALNIERGNTGGAPSSVTAIPPVPPSAMPPASTPTAAPLPLSIGTPPIADDADLIEREWVDKAKQIVAQTSHDPYLQNKEMNKVKADYLKKRFNKEIKLSEE